MPQRRGVGLYALTLSDKQTGSEEVNLKRGTNTPHHKKSIRRFSPCTFAA